MADKSIWDQTGRSDMNDKPKTTPSPKPDEQEGVGVLDILKQKLTKPGLGEADMSIQKERDRMQRRYQKY